MTISKLRFSAGLTLAAVVASLAVAGGAGARLPVEPGQGSPVSHQHRAPATKKENRRNFGGYPSGSGVHVRVPAEARTE